MQNITKNIVSVGILLQDGSEIEGKFGIINVKYKGTRMKFIRSEKYGLYYLHASLIQHRLVMIAMIYEFNYDEKLKYTEEETNKKKTE